MAWIRGETKRSDGLVMVASNIYGRYFSFVCIRSHLFLKYTAPSFFWQCTICLPLLYIGNLLPVSMFFSSSGYPMLSPSDSAVLEEVWHCGRSILFVSLTLQKSAHKLWLVLLVSSSGWIDLNLRLISDCEGELPRYRGVVLYSNKAR